MGKVKKRGRKEIQRFLKAGSQSIPLREREEKALHAHSGSFYLLREPCFPSTSSLLGLLFVGFSPFQPGGPLVGLWVHRQASRTRGQLADQRMLPRGSGRASHSPCQCSITFNSFYSQTPGPGLTWSFSGCCLISLTKSKFVVSRITPALRALAFGWLTALAEFVLKMLSFYPWQGLCFSFCPNALPPRCLQSLLPHLLFACAYHFLSLSLSVLLKENL